MYIENGCRAEFWVQRNTWGNTVAKVTHVDGAVEGPLSGREPYYGNPGCDAEFYDLRTGELLSAEPLRCPGTFSYRKVDAPPWSTRS
jgi:hypothetical protein